MAKPLKKRRQRPHDALPAGFQWRDGRPRWIPSPTRRKAGWRALDLRDAQGRFLPRGEAVSKAERIAEAVAAWAKGEPVPAAFLTIAPKGAEAAGAIIHDARGIGTLLEAYYASRKFTALAAATQRDYRNKINRLLEVVACPDAPRLADGEPDRVKIDKRVEALKGLSMDLFCAPAFGSSAPFVLEDAYEHLMENAGEHMAYGVMRAASAWMGWCVKPKRLWLANPCSQVTVEVPGGRIRPGTWPEIVALVMAADAMGWKSIGDAIVLGVDLSWNQQDLRELTWSQVSADFHVKHRRIKTGNASNPPLLSVGRARLQEIAARAPDRKVASMVKDRPVIVCETTGEKWEASYFRRRYREVRTEAMKTVPSCETLRFQDMRDTSITYCIDAGLTDEQICSRSQHTLKHCRDVREKHYGEIGQGVANTAGKKLDAHFKKMGYRL